MTDHKTWCPAHPSRQDGRCACADVEDDRTLDLFAGVEQATASAHRPLTPAQQEIVDYLAERDGIAPLDGRKHRAIEAMLSQGILEEHGCAAHKLTPHGWTLARTGGAA